MGRMGAGSGNHHPLPTVALDPPRRPALEASLRAGGTDRPKTPAKVPGPAAALRWQATFASRSGWEGKAGRQVGRKRSLLWQTLALPGRPSAVRALPGVSADLRLARHPSPINDGGHLC